MALTGPFTETSLDVKFNSDPGWHTPLSTFSESTVVFSFSLWSLVTGVEGRTDEMKTFRNNVRKIGLVYVDKVLPMTESVVEEMSNLADYLTLLEFNDWSDAEMEDIITDIEKAQAKCAILKQMYTTIANFAIDVTPIKKMNERDNMEKLISQYKQEEEYLKGNAKQLMEIPTWEMGLMEFRKFDADWPGFLAAPLETDKAVVLTKESLRPAAEDFIKGVEDFSVFLTNIKECLAKMKNVEKSAANEPSFKTMKKVGDQLSSESMKFLKMANMLCSKLFCLPTHPNDKSFVEQWFHQQKVYMEPKHNNNGSKKLDYVEILCNPLQ